MDTIINGIKYSLDNGEATIIKQDKSLSGDIVIPKTITYNGKSYKVTSVADIAFQWCALSSIDLSATSITSLPDGCFGGCYSLTTVTLPRSITSLGVGCFSYCTVLSKVICMRKDLDNVTTYLFVFNNIDPYCALFVPEGTKSVYEGTEPWRDFRYIFEPGDEATIDEGFATINGIRYHLENGEATVRRQPGRLSGDIVIPATITHKGTRYLVTKIEDWAFAFAQITSITLPESITSLGCWCFRDCPNLTSVTLPTSITSVGGYCFHKCTSLTSVDLSATSITSLPTGFFHGCKSLTSVTWPDSITSLGVGCFQHTGLTSISLPSTITSLGDDCFYHCTSLTSIDLSASSLTSLPEDCFCGCWKLASIDLSGTCITSLGKCCFYDCPALASITLPITLTSLGEECFGSCSGLTSINLPGSITALGRRCFNDCRTLSKVTCKWRDFDKVMIAPDAFTNIDQYCALYVPSGTKSIYARKDTWLDFTYIIEPGDDAAIDKKFVTINGVRYYLENGVARIRRQPSSLSGDIVIPETISHNGASYKVTSVAEKAFYECSCLNLIDMSACIGITELGNKCFALCTSLSSISLPSTLKSLGDYCFWDCWELVSINLTATLKSLGDYCFHNCWKLVSINLPVTLTSLGSHCFEGCSSLTSVTVGWTNLDDVPASGSAFADIAEETTLYVPKGTKSIYARYGMWCDFKYIIEPDEEATIYERFATVGGVRYYLENGEATIRRQSSMLSGDIVIPATITHNDTCYKVTKVAEGAFARSQVTSVDLSKTSITYLSDYCFSSCYDLKDITLPATITSLGKACFAWCFSLASITLPASLTSLPSYCFNCCTKLTSIDMPSSITSLGDYCFNGCTSLTAIDLPDSITTLGIRCFYDCTALTKFTCRWRDLSDVKTGYYVFEAVSDCALYVPRGTKSIYEGQQPWNEFKNIVEIEKFECQVRRT